MIPKKNRISKENFPSPQRQGVPNHQIYGLAVNSKLFSGVFYKNDEKVRVSVVVSKKTAKTAVLRNLIRRRFYSVVENEIENFLQKGSLVLYPKKEALTAKFSIISKEIEDTLRKGKILS